MDNPLLKAVASGLLAYSVHYVSVKAYDNFCVPDGLLGFVKGVLTTGSPVCQSVLFIDVIPLIRFLNIRQIICGFILHK